MSNADWSAIREIAQTAVLTFGALLAFLTYRMNRRDRLNALDERSLERIADRVADVGATAEAARWSPNKSPFRQAQLRLHAAIYFTPYEMPNVEALIGAEEDEVITKLMIPVASDDVAKALESLPRGPWILPRWISGVRQVEWARLRSLARQRVRLRRRKNDDNDIIHA